MTWNGFDFAFMIICWSRPVTDVPNFRIDVSLNFPFLFLSFDVCAAGRIYGVEGSKRGVLRLKPYTMTFL
jgi:hypothetical protein